MTYFKHYIKNQSLRLLIIFHETYIFKLCMKIIYYIDSNITYLI